MHNLHFGNRNSSVAFVKEWPPVSAVLLGSFSLCEPLFSGLLVLNYCSHFQKHDLTSKRVGSGNMVGWLCNLTSPFTSEKTICIENFYQDSY